MTIFGTYLQATIDRGRDEAQRDGSATVEAQHLLLAIAAGHEATTHQVLASAGLDYQAIREALDREFEHSLSAAGVPVDVFGLPEPSASPQRPGQLGASAKLAIGRGFPAGAHKKDLRPAHVLLGILQAQIGTVPRALALAGIDRTGLAERVQQALAGTG
jgi:ATP-dependent Clp protease ATP-binding subunit ClpA